MKKMEKNEQVKKEDKKGGKKTAKKKSNFHTTLTS